MPRSQRTWLINGILIALLLLTLIGGEQLGGRWVYAFPAYLLVVLALGLLYRRRKLRRE
jgi:hypothetical protein